VRARVVTEKIGQGDGLADYQAYVQGDEFAARAAQLDAADSSLAW
jgi:hypothetical protein